MEARERERELGYVINIVLLTEGIKGVCEAFWDVNNLLMRCCSIEVIFQLS